MPTPAVTTKFECFAMTPNPPALVPARRNRQWMDDFPDRHAYRCLPLTIANSHGWEVLCPYDIEIFWNGGAKMEDITFNAPGGQDYRHLVQSNFTCGIVTFHTGYLFRTEPGWNTFTSGPPNDFKDGIQPLTGIIESDWLPYPFTMNWQMTRPGVFRFSKDEPFCFVLPIPHAYMNEVTPVIRNLADEPDLERQHNTWREARAQFMTKFHAGDQATLKQAWQKYYFLGRKADTGEEVETHINKLRMNAPEDRRGTK